MQIYIAEGTQQTGPFDLETIKSGLRAGKYQPTQLAWYEGAPGWEPLSKLPGLETFLVPPPAPPAPVLSAPAFPPAPPAAAPGAPPPAPGAYPPAPGAPPSAPGGYPLPYNPPPANQTVSTGKKIGGFAAGALVVVIFLVKVLVGVSHFHFSTSSSSGSDTPTPSGSPGFSSSTSTPGFSSSSSPSAGTKHYTNKRSDFTDGDRATSFVAFSFDYPTDWRASNGDYTSDQTNYVEVTHSVQVQGTSKDAEQFAVGAFPAKGTNLAALPPATIEQIIEQSEEKVRGNFLEYHRVSKGPVQINGYNGYEYRSEATDDDDGQKIKIFMRGIVLTPGPGKDAVFLVMVSSSYLPEMRSANDVGVKGGTGVFLRSFRFQ